MIHTESIVNISRGEDCFGSYSAWQGTNDLAWGRKDLKDEVFDPIARGKAAACEMMSFSHVEKDLNRNEHLNLNPE